jgi:hypothetical protein
MGPNLLTRRKKGDFDMMMHVRKRLSPVLLQPVHCNLSMQGTIVRQPQHLPL